MTHALTVWQAICAGEVIGTDDENAREPRGTRTNGPPPSTKALRHCASVGGDPLLSPLVRINKRAPDECPSSKNIHDGTRARRESRRH